MKITYEFDVPTVQIIVAALTKAPIPWEATNPVIKYIEEEVPLSKGFCAEDDKEEKEFNHSS